MYQAILHTHNTMRWIVLIMALVAIAKAWSGSMGKKPFTSADNKLGTFLIASLHLQLLLGLILYFVSPTTTQALADFGAAMKDPMMRLRALEHPLLGIIAVAIAQIGRIKSKKATDDAAKHKKAAVFFTIALLLIVLRIPKWF